MGGSGPGGGGGISGKAASKLMDQIKGSGGFSYQVVTRTAPKGGYMVSPYKDREHVLNAKVASMRDLIRYTSRNKDLLSRPDHYFGGWMDKDSLYLDSSVRHAERATALDAAKKGGQLAIFDVEKMDSIYLEGGAN